ncbi:MAG: glycerol-3-phosphate dehydrogenase, partial [Myxococcota bacterium]|nr:glycerol-3-phosphate dehydrogenase [Myxococcota bacterium]
GARVDELAALVKSRPELGEPIEGAPNYLAVEAYYAASHEGALHLEDVLTRRTRISIETFDRGIAAARPVANLMGEVLGWNDATRQRELAHYDARVEAERESQQQPDDHTADAARLGAPDVRVGSGPGAAVVQLPQKRGGA